MTDIFRIGLVLVAVLIPTSFGAKEEEHTATAIAVDLFSNATKLAILLAAHQTYYKLRG